MEYVVQLIGSLGFPIAACVGLFWQFNKQQEAHEKDMQEQSSQYKEAMERQGERYKSTVEMVNITLDRLTDTLTENTKAITELAVLLRGKNDG